MKLRYTRIPDKQNAQGYELIPSLQVKLKHKSRILTIRVLIDSGAVDSLFHVSIAKALGMDPYGGTKKNYIGIAGQITPAYLHPIPVQIQGSNEWTEISASFVDVDTVPLLGRRGFFDNHQVIFEQYRGRFEVNSRTRFGR